VSYKKREQLTTGCVVFVCYCCVCLLLLLLLCCVCLLLLLLLCLFVIVVFVCLLLLCLFVIVVFVCYCFFLCVVCGVMVSVLASSVIVGVFEPRSCQTRDYKIDISCFSAKNAALRRKTGWLGIRILWACGRHVYPQTVVLVS
jgi:hypothetical protein